MTLTYRLVKGSALTFAEQDGNISDLDGRVVGLENLSVSNPIDAITIAGNQLTFHYTTAAGGGSDTITLPTAQWNGRGDWLPSTVYSINDLVIAQSNLYLVKIAHTSDLTFDAGKQIGGQDVYDFIFGPMGQTQSADLSASTYTLQGTDDLKFYRATAVGGCTVTIPDSGSVAIPLDSEISFRQCAGQMVFDWSTPVAVNVPDGFDARTNYIGAVITLKKIGTDEWDIFGALVLLTA
jgi:hypothetical protein